MILIAKWTVIAFGLFIIVAGFIMLFAPKKAGQILRKAGSTNFVNYTEITLRMIPAAGMILYSDFTEFPQVFKILGWFMIITSFVLYFVPRQMHHNYSLRCAEIIRPFYFQLISALAFLFGAVIIYCVI